MVPHFGARVVEEAIIDKNKWRYSGLALVDDRPFVPRGPNNSNIATWKHTLFGWAHLGQEVATDAEFRLLDWHDQEGLILTLEIIENTPHL